MNSLNDVKQSTRQELIDYLESWGTACYDDESTSLLREAAVDTFKTEGSTHRVAKDILARHREYVAQRRRELRKASINTQ